MLDSATLWITLLTCLLAGGLGFPMSSDMSAGEAMAARLCWALIVVIIGGLIIHWDWGEKTRPVERLFSIGVLLGVVILAGIAVKWIDTKELSAYEGVLIPGNSSTPPIPAACQNRIPQGALMVFVGSNVAWATQFPFPIIIMDKKIMLAVDRGPKARSLRIHTLRIFDDSYEIIARVEGNEFSISKNVRKKRPDRHTLQVFDRRDEMVLSLNFLNPDALSIDAAIFRHSQTPPIVSGPTAMKIGGTTVIGSCFGNGGFNISKDGVGLG